MQINQIPIQNYSSKLTEKSSGFWVVNENHHVSYTPDGHAHSYEMEENSFWYQHRNNILLSVINRFPSEWLLDIGGGTGFVSAFLQKNDIPTVLLEPVKQGALLSKQRNVKQVICGKLEDVDFYPGSIPAIALFDILEHIEDDLPFLESCNKILQDDGRIYITTPAYQHLWSDFDKRVGHYRRYNIPRLKQLLNKAGFDVEYSSYFFYLLPPFIWLFRVLVKRNYHQDSVVKKQRDHGLKMGILSRIVSFFLKLEYKIIHSKGRVRFGSSCLLVARKRK